MIPQTNIVEYSPYVKIANEYSSWKPTTQSQLILEVYFLETSMRPMMPLSLLFNSQLQRRTTVLNQSLARLIVCALETHDSCSLDGQVLHTTNTPQLGIYMDFTSFPPSLLPCSSYSSCIELLFPLTYCINCTTCGGHCWPLCRHHFMQIDCWVSNAQFPSTMPKISIFVHYYLQLAIAYVILLSGMLHQVL